MVQIPMSGDVAEIVGDLAERVENRSHLLDKFIFHKSWPVAQDEQGIPVKWDDASRWSFTRIAEDSAFLLKGEARKKERAADGRNIEQDKADRLRREATLAQRLSSVRWNDAEIALLRAKHTRRFVTLFRQAKGDRAAVLIAQLEARLAINLSDSLIQNAGISLDRLFGLPYIPGSAIKGVCRHAALEELKAVQGNEQKQRLFETFQTVFGASETDYREKGALHEFRRYAGEKEQQTRRGAIDFLPAYPVNQAMIAVDLTNVHYPDYYRTGKETMLAKEQPRPNPFPVVEPGARFAICLVANGMDEKPGILNVAVYWLKLALTIRGLGAKTASGYGWFSIPENGLLDLDEEERRERENADKERMQAQERQAEAAKKAQAARELAERTAAKKEEEKRRAVMTPAEIADETVAGWDSNKFTGRLRDFLKTKSGPSEEDKKAMVRALRSTRADIWTAFKEKAQKGDMAKIRDAIFTINKQLGLGKMP